MVTTYIADKSFRGFVRAVIALPLLPMSDLLATIDELKAWKFDETALNHDQQIEFQSFFISYLEDVWVNGVYPPRDQSINMLKCFSFN